MNQNLLLVKIFKLEKENCILSFVYKSIAHLLRLLHGNVAFRVADSFHGEAKRTKLQKRCNLSAVRHKSRQAADANATAENRNAARHYAGVNASDVYRKSQLECPRPFQSIAAAFCHGFEWSTPLHSPLGIIPRGR